MHESKDAKAAIQALSAPGPRNASRHVQALLPEIEAARANGVPFAEINAALKASGIEVSLQSLYQLVYRARKRARKNENPASKETRSAQQSSTSAKVATGPKTQSKSYRNRPVDLRALEKLGKELDEKGIKGLNNI